MNSAQFNVSEKWSYRPGSGYGIAQSHMIGEIQWSPKVLQKCFWIFEELEVLTGENLALKEYSDSFDTLNQVNLILQTVAALQRFAKIAISRSSRIRIIPNEEDTHFQRAFIAIASGSQSATKSCLNWLFDNLLNPPASISEIRHNFFEFQESIKKYSIPGANSWRTLQAAYDEDLPVLPFFDHAYFIGTGCHRRVFKSFITDKTSFLGMLWAQNKYQTSRLLRSYGLPGAVNFLVKTQDEAISSANKVGYPVVVKPNDRDQGVGVSANIISESDLIAAFHTAKQHSNDVLVEKFQQGFTHRFSVIDGNIVRVAKHIGFGVFGDGIGTICQLVKHLEQKIENKKRAWSKPSTAAHLDDEALGLLRQQGFTPDTIPAKGEYIRLRRKDNVSAGGQRITLEIKDVHPDNLALALNACKLLTLDLAGIDLISPDISRSWRELPATICEVNGNPQLVARDDPEMYKRVLRHLMDTPCRILTNLIVIPERNQHWSKLCVQTLPSSSKTLGISDIQGIWLDDVLIGGPFESGFHSARALLTHSSLSQIYIVMTIAEIMRYGLPVDKFDTILMPWNKPPSKEKIIHEKWRNFVTLIKPHAMKLEIFKS